MLIREIGNSGIMASAVAFGAWALGGGTWWGKVEDDQSIMAIHAAIDAGVTLFDTAPAYNWGHSEDIVGRALQGKRDKVVLSTKCGLWWQDDRGSYFFDIDGKTVRRSLRPETIRIEVEQSLKRLRTDYIDIYHTHWQSVEPDFTPIAETMGCLMDLKKEGKIRAIGVSNCTPEQMDEYRKIGEIADNQPKYSILDRKIEEDVIPYCIKNEISIFAYSPLEQGLLTGRINMTQTFPEGEHRNAIPWYKPENRGKVLAMLYDWRTLTEKYDCTMSQLVIAWTFSQPGVDFVLCGARKPDHAKENAEAGRLMLNGDDIEKMRLDAEALGTAV
jgi:methylglyoxal reductase